MPEQSSNVIEALLRFITLARDANSPIGGSSSVLPPPGPIQGMGGGGPTSQGTFGGNRSPYPAPEPGSLAPSRDPQEPVEEEPVEEESPALEGEDPGGGDEGPFGETPEDEQRTGALVDFLMGLFSGGGAR